MADHTLENELYVDNEGRVFYRVYLDATQMRRLVGEFQNNRSAVQSLGRAVKGSVQERRAVQDVTMPVVPSMAGPNSMNISANSFDQVEVGDVLVRVPVNFHPKIKEEIARLVKDWHSGHKISVDKGETGYTINDRT